MRWYDFGCKDTTNKIDSHRGQLLYYVKNVLKHKGGVEKCVHRLSLL